MVFEENPLSAQQGGNQQRDSLIAVLMAARINRLNHGQLHQLAKLNVQYTPDLRVPRSQLPIAVELAVFLE